MSPAIDALTKLRVAPLATIIAVSASIEFTKASTVPFEKQNKGRLLSAGFHLQVGYYRDDAPLYDMLLNDEQKARFDEMWRELYFVTDVLARQFQDCLAAVAIRSGVR